MSLLELQADTREPNASHWIPDHSVNSCYGCKLSFTFYRRKHHCRMCGRIFCAYCACTYREIPADFENTSHPSTHLMGYLLSFVYSSASRVCHPCNKRIDSLLASQAYLLIFSRIPLRTLSRISTVSKLWRSAYQTARSLLRDIEYLLPGTPLNRIQKALLETNRNDIQGHSRLMIRSFFLPSSPPLSNFRRSSCKQLMCHSTCTPKIPIDDLLELFYKPFPSVSVKNYALTQLRGLSEDHIFCLLPQLIFALRFEDKNNCQLFEFLLTLARQSLNLRINIYWTLSYLKHEFMVLGIFVHLFLEEMQRTFQMETVARELIRGRVFFKVLVQMNQPESSSGIPIPKIDQQYGDYLKKYSPYIPIRCSAASPEGPSEESNTLVLPLNTNYTIVQLNAHQIFKKKSSNQPLVIPLTCTDRHGMRTEQAILYKEERPLQDFIIVRIIKMMDLILCSELKTDFGIRVYGVLPYNPRVGLIEMIPHSETIHSILHLHHFTIQNYLIEKNRHIPIKELRNRFVKSAAAYSVISYLLGVGDRHLDNIMITDDGYLFHIDYGFILGDESRPISPAMRVTRDIVDAMGGEKSSDFDDFRNYCKNIYNCLRRHCNLFMNMLLILTDQGCGMVSQSRLSYEMAQRFIPTELNENADVNILIQIDDGYRSLTSNLMVDFLHYHVKENLSKII